MPSKLEELGRLAALSLSFPLLQSVPQTNSAFRRTQMPFIRSTLPGPRTAPGPSGRGSKTGTVEVSFNWRADILLMLWFV